ncbi:MAG: VOC family protein [Bacteroidota bacterium]
MSYPFVPSVGATFSADMAVPDHERESRFYARVLSTGTPPLWHEDLMNNRGRPIIGVGPRRAEHDTLPLQWMPHIQVADVAASVDRARGLGGSTCAQSNAEDGANPWAVLTDTQGAAFGLIPVASVEPPSDATPPQEASVLCQVRSDRSMDVAARDRQGVQGARGRAPGDADNAAWRVTRRTAPINRSLTGHSARVGRIAWLDLTVTNASAARDFYRDVVGWSVEQVEMEDASGPYTDYTMLDADGRPAAGLCHARGVNRGLPPVWLIHLAVGDLAESLRRVGEEGGQVVKASQDAEGTLVRAVVQDPVGVYLALVQDGAS